MKNSESSGVLIVCMGNTCRSPMAEAIARRLLGKSIQVSSAGLETESDLPAASNARAVMREMGLDLSLHRSKEIKSLDLLAFGRVIATVLNRQELWNWMCPTLTARALRSTARLRKESRNDYTLSLTSRIGGKLNPDPIAYLSNAIARSEGGHVDSVNGSHLAGVFSKCAKSFEKEICALVNRLLDACQLDYPRDLRALSIPPLQKATLGNLVAVLKEARRIRPIPVGEFFHDKTEDLLKNLEQINNVWVQVKHGDDVMAAVLVERMKTMLVIFKEVRSPANKQSRPS